MKIKIADEHCYADAHCDYLYKTLEGANFYTDSDGLAISKANLDGSGLKLLGMAAFCGREKEQDVMLEKVTKQIEHYYKMTEPTKIPHIYKLKGIDTNTYLALEGTGYINSVKNLESLLEYDFLAAGLMWNSKSSMGGSAYDDGELTPLGKMTAKIMNERHIKIDLAHTGYKTFFDLCDCIEKPFISHGNVLDLCSHCRNYSKEQIKEMIKRDTFIGLTFFKNFVGGNNDIETFYRHIDYILQLGGENVVGIGSDFDGCDDTVINLNSPRDYNKLYDYLLNKQLSEAVINAICYKNLEKFLNIGCITEA